MKLSRMSSYAVRALVHLAGQETGWPVASHTIAQAKGMPERFLLKVLVALVRARILLSVKGPNGGYRLVRSAKDISLLEIVEAVDGPIRGDAPREVDVDGGQLDRRLQAACDHAAEIVRAALGRVSVAELPGRRKGVRS
jgi:Rrf2 family protein